MSRTRPYLNPTFWIDAAERAVKTFAQTAVAIIGAEAISILSVDWIETGLVSLTAAVVSLLTSVGSAQIGERGTASAIDG